MDAVPRGTRVFTPVVVCAIALLLLFLTGAPPAHADATPGEVTISPASPVVGDTVTALGFPRECPSPGTTYSFAITNGSQTVSSGSATYSVAAGGVPYSFVPSQASPPNVASYTATMDARCTSEPGSDQYTSSSPFEVNAALAGTSRCHRTGPRLPPIRSR